ncbi:methanogenesis marker 16 metalloprotein [Methanobrevibacter sp. OttesenSCG-928-K11]|nr:methanogenesis marker 16 metalloprotein [Methanobrevibacter sp. OttesenSCG-928-K11]MDL2270921.1 methanogenesis marker 16 metalloprotein [Methanobrevibacter sp. OttesenSCG-928-I08]
MTRTIEEINEKINNNEVNVFTINEFKELIKENNAPSFDEVDVVTASTCGVMSGTAAIFNLVASEPGVFKRAKEIYLNDIPANVGPCPNEWLGTVDLILHGTSHSLNDKNYGGGFLLHDLLEGEDISIKVKTIDGDIIESSTSLDEMGKAQLIGTRMAFKNYTAFTNPGDEDITSIFSSTPLKGNYSGITFSGCGELNPLENDPNLNVINEGSKILLNHSEGIVLGEGTRSSTAKPNLMLSADIKKMNSDYIGGFRTGEGPEIYNTVAIPIPVINEDVYHNLLITNEKIPLPVADIKGRHIPLTETTYAEMWDNHSERPHYDKKKCLNCDKCKVEEVCPTKAFKNKDINLRKCFGCGTCIYHCKANAFEMNIGKVDLDIKNANHEIPIYCRQSDILRAKKLSLKLKDMIINKEFLLR